MGVPQVVCTVKLEDAAAVPCDVQFDPLSKAYLLLLCSNGAVSLYGVGEGGASLDLVSCMTSLCCTAKSFSTSTVEVGRFCNSLPQVTSLAKQPAARRTAAFVPNAPGNFAVISDKSGEWHTCVATPWQLHVTWVCGGCNTCTRPREQSCLTH